MPQPKKVIAECKRPCSSLDEHGNGRGATAAGDTTATTPLTRNKGNSRKAGENCRPTTSAANVAANDQSKNRDNCNTGACDNTISLLLSVSSFNSGLCFVECVCVDMMCMAELRCARRVLDSGVYFIIRVVIHVELNEQQDFLMNRIHSTAINWFYFAANASHHISIILLWIISSRVVIRTP